MSKKANEIQKKLFTAIAQCGELILAMEVEGCAVNLVGEFSVRQYAEEDRLDVNDGAHHVHINWEKIKRVAQSVDPHYGEGLLNFCHHDKILFKLYCPSGQFPASVTKIVASHFG